ncbi:GNAT family N-acetyltransferase [Candidatus Kaiserbacteria bacterium]|nr:GNAT family N-acetyltransferase [Candidatus Kaiserbacteria bacterium]
MQLTFDEFNADTDTEEYLRLTDDNLRLIRGDLTHFFLNIGEKKRLQGFLKNSVLFTIKVNHELAGFTAYTLIKDRRTALIERFNLKTRFRGQGFGTRALEFVEAKAKESGCSRLELAVYASNPALRLYKRFGFKKIGLFRGICWWIYRLRKDM